MTVPALMAEVASVPVPDAVAGAAVAAVEVPHASVEDAFPVADSALR